MEATVRTREERRFWSSAGVAATPFYVERQDGGIEHRAEPLMLVLALLVIPALVLEASHSMAATRAGFALNVVIWAGFAVELAFVLIVSQHRRRTLRAHWLDAVIVVLSVPFVPSLLQGARMIRLLRLLRLLRLTAFGARGYQTARRVFTPGGFRYVVVVVGLIVVVSGAAMAVVDTKDVHSFDEGVWWALVTVTTVGYGDIEITTAAGRVIAAFVMLAGIGFMAALTATIAAAFVKQERHDTTDVKLDKTDVKLDQVLARLERVERALGDLREPEPFPPAARSAVRRTGNGQ
jgi:voltage-gated potassium channel